MENADMGKDVLGMWTNKKEAEIEILSSDKVELKQNIKAKWEISHL